MFSPFVYAVLLWLGVGLALQLVRKKETQIKKEVIVLKDTQAELAELDGLEVELCGRWLWISGRFKQHERTLEKLGCRYHDTKGTWYWRDKKDKKTSKTDGWLISKIRDRFGSVTLQDVLKAKNRREHKAEPKRNPTKERPVELAQSQTQGNDEW